MAAPLLLPLPLLLPPSAPSCLSTGAPPPLTAGGPLPEGADAVVQIEDTQFLGADSEGKRRVKIQKGVAPGTDIRQVRAPAAAALGTLGLLASAA